MGVFDSINAALTGKSPAPAASSAPASKRGPATGDWDLELDIKRRNMAAQGMALDGSPLSPGTSSGLDTAMQRHADKAHPIGKPPALRK